jgi:hypothetical protein
LSSIRRNSCRQCEEIVDAGHYALLDSSFGGSGTIGKRLVNLEVRSRRGTVPLYLALARTILKLGIPVVLFKIGITLMFKHPSVGGLAIILVAFLILPISIAVGRGSVGLHDALTQTSVARRSLVNRETVTGLRYWTMSVLATVILALPLAASIKNGVWGYSPLPVFPTVAKVSSPFADVAKELLYGDGSEAIRPFVRDLQVMQTTDLFPDEFQKSFTKVPPELVRQIHGQRGELEVQIEVTERGFASHSLQSALIQRIGTVLLPLVVPGEVVKFVWLRIGTREIFGPIQLFGGNTCIVLGRRRPDGRTIEMNIVEPDDNRFYFLSFQLSGFWVHHPSAPVSQ